MALVSTAQITITDQNDYIFTGQTAPLNPIANVTLWIDTSLTPSQQKRWTGSKWEIVNEVVFGAKNLILNSKVSFTTSQYAVTQLNLSENLIEGQEYVFTAKSTVGTATLGLWRDEGHIYVGSMPVVNGRHILKFVCPPKAAQSSLLNRISVCNLSTPNIIGVSNFMLQKGNRELDYSQAPEDNEAAINAINSTLSDFANDNKLTADEKQTVKKEWDAIAGEYSKLIAQADSLSVSRTVYAGVYSALNSYLNVTIISPNTQPLLANLNTTSDIVGSTFRNNFTNYYNARTDLQNALTAKVQNNINAATEFGNGKNILPNSEFTAGINSWALGNTTVELTPSLVGNNLTSDWALNGNTNLLNSEGLNTVFIEHKAFVNKPTHYTYISQVAKGIQGGKKYIVSAYVANHRAMEVSIFVQFYDSNGEWIGWSGEPASSKCASNEAMGGQNINGYKRIFAAIVAPQNSVSAMVVVRKFGTIQGAGDSYMFLCRPMLEEVKNENTKPGPWSPATSSAQAAQAQAQIDAANYLKTAIAQVTEVNGGLVLAAALCARDTNGQVRAYLNGLAQKAYAVAAGVSGWGTGSETAKSWIDFLGNAKFGNLRIGVNGEGKTWIEDQNRVTRFQFSVENIETLASLLNAAGQSTNVTVQSFTTYEEGEHTLAQTITVNADDSELTLSGGITATVQVVPPNSANCAATLILYRNGVLYATIANVFVSGTSTNEYNEIEQYVETSTFNTKLIGVPAGTYSLRVVTDMEFFSSGSASVITSNISLFAFKSNDKRAMVFGADGLFSFWNAANYFYYSALQGLKVRGNVDMPGLLAAGFGAVNGGHTKRIGSKSNIGNITRVTAGIYNVPHNVGHTNYTVQVTPTGNGAIATTPGNQFTASRFQVAIMDRNGNFIDSDFQYAIFGDNNI